MEWRLSRSEASSASEGMSVSEPRNRGRRLIGAKNISIFFIHFQFYFIGVQYSMRNFFSFLLFFSILLISNMTGLAAQSKSIFSVEPAGEGDFYNVTVEPSSIDLEAYINQTFELIRQKNDRILEFNNTTKKNLSDLNKDAKDSIDGKKNEIRDFLGLEKDKSKDVSAASQEEELHEMPDSENPMLAEDEKKLKESEIKKIEDENAAIPRRQKFISYCLDNLCGYPYVSGGASPKTGFDCSGLVQYAARESLGIKLPRTDFL